MVKLSGKEQYPIYFGANSELLRIASDLRKLMTPAEKILWEHLRNRQLLGFRFRNEDVMQNIENVLTRIKAELKNK